MIIVRYFFVGGVAAAVDISLFAIFAVWLGFDYLLVGPCSFVLATLVNYALSIRFVFESGVRFSQRHEVLIVFLVSGVGLLVNQGVLYFGVDMLELNKLIAKLGATATVFLWNYWARAHFVFKAAACSKDLERQI